MEMLKVELNGTEKEYPYGTSLLEIAGEHQDKYENDILLALLNNHLIKVRALKLLLVKFLVFYVEKYL